MTTKHKNVHSYCFKIYIGLNCLKKEIEVLKQPPQSESYPDQYQSLITHLEYLQFLSTKAMALSELPSRLITFIEEVNLIFLLLQLTSLAFSMFLFFKISN